MLSIVLVEVIILVPSLYHEKHTKEMMAQDQAYTLLTTVKSSLSYEESVVVPELYERLLSHHDSVKGYAVCTTTDLSLIHI